MQLPHFASYLAIALPVNSVSFTTPAKKICTTHGIWGAKSFSFHDLGLRLPSPYVELPLVLATLFSQPPRHGRRPGAEFGGTKKFLVIDLVLRIFPFFSHIFRMFTMLNVVYDHFLT